MNQHHLPRERRHHDRARFGRLVHFEIAGGLMTATVEELSETGMRLDGPWVPPLDSEITIHLPLRGKRGKVSDCTLRGRVVRQDDSAFGVAFTELLPRHMLQLRDYVWRAEPYFGP